ncbi:hypothetical protein V866_002634 [Kwoniella sp. B9012]|uniref:Restriction endonuclease type IV Mrr domain-containing protein n=1 Tax=Kwoniella europaea PYCC6329 TaxID=1423913 RepID=A0AAX4KGJ9_9TREE
MTILPKFRGRTTLDIGTSFEKHALKYLNNQLYMDLRRVGGAGDGGIDLRGWWWLPRSPRMSGDMTEAKNESVRRVRVIVQCKAEKKSLGPRNVRELEGVMGNLRFHSNPSSTSTLSLSSSSEPSDSSLNPYEEDIAILISQSGFTKSTMLYSTSSNIPLMLVHLPGGDPGAQSEHEAEEEGPFDDGGQEIEVKSLWWNKALSEGVLGNEIELRRTIGPKGVGVGLWMGGRKIGRCEPKEGR